MKILHIGKFYPIRGGVEKVMLDITAGLSARGIDCDMLCASASGGPRTVRLNPHGSIFAVRTLRKMYATMISPAMIWRLRRIAGRYDIIHIHHPDPMAALALRLSGFRGKVVLHWHSDILRQKKLLRLFRPLQDWLIARADTIVGTSPVYIAHSPWLTGVQHKCVCVPIGIRPIPMPDVEKVEALRDSFPGKKIVLALGRLVGYKGFEFLVDSAQYLPDDYVIVIGGDGPLRESLQQRIDSQHLGDKVKLAGFVADEDLPVYFYASSLFCLSSVERTEAFGVVQIEAMSCGMPVIATEIPGSGVAWVNAHGRSGLNVPPRNPVALAAAIVAATASANMHRTYRRGARLRYEELFTETDMLDNILNVYNTILSHTETN